MKNKYTVINTLYGRTIEAENACFQVVHGYYRDRRHYTTATVYSYKDRAFVVYDVPVEQAIREFIRVR